MTTTLEIPAHELPDWMRQARRSIDWGTLLAFTFSLIVALPFITNRNLPHTNYTENYVYRTADYAAVLREGRLYPRWATNAFGGYGAPIPQFVEPGAAYVAAALQVLLTDDPVLAVRLVYGMALGAAGIMVYLFVAQHAGRRAGLLSAVLYVYSPYVGLTAPHILGSMPEVMAFALMPFFLWSIDRNLLRQRPLNVMFIAAATSGLILTHIPSALISTVMGCILILGHWRTKGRFRVLLTSGSYALGIGMAGFHWLPALLEQDAIHWRPPIAPTSYRLTLHSLLTPPQPVDLDAFIHTPQFSLGIAVVLFSLASLITIVFSRGQRGWRFQTLFLVTGLVLGSVTLIWFPQAVWILGAVTLCFSVGGSSIMVWRDQIAERWRRLFLPTLLIIIWITSVNVWLPPVANEPFGNTDPQTQIQHELQGYGIATLPPTEPIPSTLPENMEVSRSLIESYQSTNINKIGPSQFTTTFQAGILEHDSHSDRFQVQNSQPTTLNILTAYFPGWRATLSGQPIPLYAHPSTKLIQVDVPRVGTGELILTLGTTPVRLGAWLISGSCLLLVLVITWSRMRRERIPYYDDEPLLRHQETRLLTVLLASFAIIASVFNSTSFPMFLRPQPGFTLRGSVQVLNRTDTGLSLLAFRLENNQYRAGETIPLTLYWQAQRFLPDNYQVKVYLSNNRDQSVWSEIDFHHPGNYPTRRWKNGLFVEDTYRFDLPSDVPDGNYQIHVEVNTCSPDCTAGQPVTFFNIDGQLIGNTLVLPTLIVVDG